MLTQWSFSSFILLIVSLLALLLAPNIFSWVNKDQRLQRYGTIWIDIVLIAVVVLHILPNVLLLQGYWALLLLAASYGFTVFAHKGLARNGVGQLSIAFATLAGLVTHGLMDGISIRLVDFGGISYLTALALLLHRCAASLILWNVVLQSRGKKMAALALGLLGAGTLGGYLAGQQAWAILTATQMDDYLQGIMAGVLLGMIGRIQYSERTHSLTASC